MTSLCFHCKEQKDKLLLLDRKFVDKEFVPYYVCEKCLDKFHHLVLNNSQGLKSGIMELLALLNK